MKIYSKGNWLDLTDQLFDTKKAAFNYAHDHYLIEQKKMFPLTRITVFCAQNLDPLFFGDTV